jgi:3'-phosphoadenosine 5'-phosphosulfate sulfotransferase (PAPS reductase)/FAD synthetase
MSDIAERLRQATQVITDAVEKYDLKAIVALNSGGHDSLLSTWCAAQHPLFQGAVFANTGIGTIETRAFVRDTHQQYGWPLIELKNSLMTYEMLLVRYGYPSPVTHQMMYRHLKDRQFEEAITIFSKKLGCKRGQIGLVTGLRKWESRKRQLTVKPVKIHKEAKAKSPKRVFLAPCHDFHESERNEAIEWLNLPTNRFAKYIGHSYECMCGANMGADERERRAKYAPIYEEAERKREALVKAAYDLQQFRLENGLIDPEDATINGERLTWGWHTGTPFTYEDTEDDDTLCAGCMVKRAPDGTAGVDIDRLMLEKRDEVHLTL